MNQGIARRRGFFSLPSAFVGRYCMYARAWHVLVLVNLPVVVLMVVTEPHWLLHNLMRVIEFVVLALQVCFPLAIIAPNVFRLRSDEEGARAQAVDLVGFAAAPLLISVASLVIVIAATLHAI